MFALVPYLEVKRLCLPHRMITPFPLSVDAGHGADDTVSHTRQRAHQRRRMQWMFTIGALVVRGRVAKYAEECNIADRQQTALITDDELRAAILHARQDLKLIAFLLYEVLAGLGIIADLIIIRIIVDIFL